MCRTTRRPDALQRIVGAGDHPGSALVLGLESVPAPALAVGRTLPGRGAWVCADPACVARLHEKALSRALRTTVTTADREDLQRRLA